MLNPMHQEMVRESIDCYNASGFCNETISFFRGGYFATASMIYPRASCRVVLK